MKTIYLITKESFEIRNRSYLKLQDKDYLYGQATSGDREPSEIARFTDITSAQEAFKKIIDGIYIPGEVTVSNHSGIYFAEFDLYEVTEYNVNGDGDIIDGGDVSNWLIV